MSDLKVIRKDLEEGAVFERIEQMLGDKAQGFVTSVVTMAGKNKEFSKVDSISIRNAALVAASFDLPIDSNLGYSAILPYNSKNGKKAQFQIMAKGFLQLAIRSGQYKTIHVTEVYSDEIDTYVPMTGELVFSSMPSVYREEENEEEVVGYCAYFRLISGYEKGLYMTKTKIQKHGKKYSKSYSSPLGLWQTDFDTMAKKTVLKQLLSKWGLLSIQMQDAIKYDQSIVEDDLSPRYTDNPKKLKAPKVENKLSKDGKGEDAFTSGLFEIEEEE